MSDQFRYLLIGGGVAAYNALKRIRRVDSGARVAMVTADTLPPYDLPPLSKEFLRGEKGLSEILFPSMEAIGLAEISLIRSTPVTELDADNRSARLANGRYIRFDLALLATGASPIKLRVPGVNLAGIFYLRTADDATHIAAAAGSAKRAAVIGAGFIGLEIAASLKQMGLEVVILEAHERIWPRFADPAVASFVQAECEARGVQFHTGETVVGIEGDGHVRSVLTASGLRIECDLVCVGIGIRPNVELAQASGLKVDDGVVVDEGMRTSAPHIFAAGDVVNYPDPICGRHIRAEHWGHAEYSGQLAGRNMAGADARYDFMNYAWTDIFDLHIESAGHLDGHDEVVLRGRIQDRAFTVLYLRDEILVGYCAVNVEPVEFATYRRLIRSRQPLTRQIEGLRDPRVSIKMLLKT